MRNSNRTQRDDIMQNITFVKTLEANNPGNQPLISYRTSTNIMVYPVIDRTTNRQLPGLYDILMQHQDNTIMPYSLVNAAVVHSFIDPKDGRRKKQKNQVSLSEIDSMTDPQNPYPYISWLFQLSVPQNDGANAIIVIKSYTPNPTATNPKDRRDSPLLDVAVFRRNINGYYESDDIIEDRYETFMDAVFGNIYADSQRSPEPVHADSYETPSGTVHYANGSDRPYEAASSSIVPSNPAINSPYANQTAAEPADGRTGTGYVVMSVISMIAYGLQTFMIYMITHGIQLTAVFAVLTVLSLISLIVSVKQHSNRLQDPYAPLTAAKTMSILLFILLILEIAAVIAVFVMYKMHALPDKLAFLYTTL